MCDDDVKEDTVQRLQNFLLFVLDTPVRDSHTTLISLRHVQCSTLIIEPREDEYSTLSSQPLPIT